MPNIYPAVTKQSNPPVETEVLRPTTKVQGNNMQSEGLLREKPKSNIQ